MALAAKVVCIGGAIAAKATPTNCDLELLESGDKFCLLNSLCQIKERCAAKVYSYE
jgi:hypothetical protein